MQESEGDFLNRPQLPKSWSSQIALVVKNPSANAGEARDTVSIPGSGRSPGEGNDYPLQCSCLGNPVEQRSLVGYSPWGCKESDTTKQLPLANTVKVTMK